jgi:hypothetical protein
MTHQELRESAYEIINILIAKRCYIKGFGKKFRVMDENHNPVQNISQAQMDTLFRNNIISQDRFIYRPRVIANPFSSPLSIKIPVKLTENEHTEGK